MEVSESAGMYGVCVSTMLLVLPSLSYHMQTHTEQMGLTKPIVTLAS